MPHQRTTRLSSQQFATVLITSQTRLIWHRPNEKPRKLSLNQTLQMTLIYHRHNLTEELLAGFFGISQSTVSRTIRLREKALHQVLQPLTQPLSKAHSITGSLVIDETLIPVWNWRSQGKINFSGKHKRAGFNHQIICTLDGRLLAITDPLPGAMHNAYCFKEHGLDQLLDSSTLADKGYIGLGLATPNKRPAGGQMSRNRTMVNRQIKRLRSVVERAIAQVKTWRVLHSGFRRPLGVYGRVFSVMRGLVLLATSGTL